MAVPGKRQTETAKLSILCDPCTFAKESVDAIAFCVQCIEHLCIDCLRHHRKMKATRVHEVLCDKEMPSDTSPFEKLQSLMKCPIHPDQNVIYKCEDHSDYICVSCAKGDHMTCPKVVEVAKHADKERSSEAISTYLSSSDNSRMETCLAEIQSNISSLAKQKTSVLARRNQLIKLFNKVIQFLGDSKREIDNLIKTETDKLQMKTCEIKSRISKCTEAESFLKTVMKFGDAAQLCIAVDRLDAKDSDHIEDAMSSTYGIEDCLGPDIEKMIEKLLTAKFAVIIKENKIAEVGSSLRVMMQSTAKENGSQETSSESILTKRNILHVPNIRNISISANTSELSMRNKTPMSDSESASLPITKIYLGNISCTSGELGIAVTERDVYAITIRCSKTVLFLDEYFALMDWVSLTDDPVGVCCISQNRIAIAGLDRKIRKYDISDAKVRLYHGFTLPNHCIDISSYSDEELVCLCTETPPKGLQDENKGPFYIEIRDQFHGHIRKTINLARLPEFRVPLSVFSKEVGEIVLRSRKRIDILSDTGKISETFYFKEVSSVTGDLTGTIYALDKSNNCLVKVFEKDKLVLNYGFAEMLVDSAITYSTKSKRLVLVGVNCS